MIKAINKQGKISLFGERAWDMMAKDKNGFREFVEGEVQINVPDEIKEFQAKVSENAIPEPIADIPVITLVAEVPDIHSEKPEVTPQTTAPFDAAAEMDVMREFLASKGVKHHPMMGYDKLKALYDANK